MGAHYALDAQYTSIPIEVEGRAHWLVHSTDECAERISILLAFHDAIKELGKQTLHVTHAIIIRFGGADQDWSDMCAAAANSSDTDDVVEILADSAWGQRLLWVAWHLFAGYSK
jgi:hypothetical protein